MSRFPRRTRARRRPAATPRPVAAAAPQAIREGTPGAQPPAGATRPPGVPPAASHERGKYVYCIVNADEPPGFGPIGFGTPPAEVYTVLYEDIAAVVSDAPLEVLATRDNVLAHERVNEAVMRSQTVIPMSFGTTFKSRDDIVELLRGAHGAFKDVLAKMENKVEFGLKVLWDRDAMVRHIERDDEDIRREIFAALRDVCVASRANRSIGDKMIMNAVFLVERKREAAFDARVKRLGATFDALTFRYTGPWPPYNFVNIRLKLEGAQIERRPASPACNDSGSRCALS